MKQSRNNTYAGKSCLLLSVAVLLVAAAIAVYVVRMRPGRIATDTSQRTATTPTIVKTMQEIGEWEFLTITDEELIDTVRNGLFGRDELIRIYYGTLRLGINMHKTTPQWLTVSGDTLRARLPRIELLDRNFIDEARTQSFYESGSWTDEDRKQLYRRAYEAMRRRCMTAENIGQARRACQEQFTQIFRALGYRNVSITHEE